MDFVLGVLFTLFAVVVYVVVRNVKGWLYDYDSERSHVNQRLIEIQENFFKYLDDLDEKQKKTDSHLDAQSVGLQFLKSRLSELEVGLGKRTTTYEPTEEQ
jgi:hypothetical protein